MDDQSIDLHASAQKTWLTLSELCLQSRYSSPTIYRWKNAGLIPFVQPGGKGGHLRFPVDALAMIQAQQVGTESQAQVPATTDTSAKLPGRRPKYFNQYNNTSFPSRRNHVQEAKKAAND